MNQIHPTAIIDPTAELGTGNYIGPFTIIGPNVRMGNNNRIEGHAAIGTAGEHRDYMLKTPGRVHIGSDCIIREFVTINAGTKDITILEDKVTMLRGSHIGHDAIIRKGANLSCNVLIGGHTIIGEGANLGLGAAVHQFRVLGAYSMVGMNSTVTRHIPPFVIAFGTPCEAQRINRVGLSRSGVADEQLQQFETWYQEFKQTDQLPSLSHIYASHLNSYAKDLVNCDPRAHGSMAPKAA